jgi:hypothetical protein
MAKKQKRKVSAVVGPASIPQVEEIPVLETRAAAAPRIPGRRTTTAPEFNPDYSYIIKDLKRIGILASSFFVILIILSFIIR